MGAWGEQPKQNDSTGDLFDDVTAHAAYSVNKLFKKTKNVATDDRWTRLGVLQKVVEGMPAIIGDLHDTLKYAAHVDIELVLEDERWIAEWRTPKKTVAALKRFRARLERELLKL